MSTYDEVTTITSVAAGRYTADIHPDWTVAGKPNGGYLQAVASRAALAEAQHPHVISASSIFLRAPDPGPVDIEVELLRTGRGTSQLRSRIIQDDQAQVETLIVLGDLTDAARTPAWAHPDLPEPGAPFTDCPRYAPPLDVFPSKLMHLIDLHPEPGSFGFLSGKPTGTGELRAWMNLPQTESFDALALMLAGDVLPPATFEVQQTGWVPTIELSTYIRALPVPGPVQLHFRAGVVQGEKVDEICTVWDSEGTLVAQANQLAAIRM